MCIRDSLYACCHSPSLRREHRCRCGLSLLSPTHWTTVVVEVVVVVAVTGGKNAGWQQKTGGRRKLCKIKARYTYSGSSSTSLPKVKVVFIAPSLQSQTRGSRLSASNSVEPRFDAQPFPSKPRTGVAGAWRRVCTARQSCTKPVWHKAAQPPASRYPKLS